jgi:ribosomal protein S7
MDKISNAQAGQMMKLAAENLRALSEENVGLRTQNDELITKVASYEKRERVEKIAKAMESKGLESELSFEEKVAGLSKRDNLDVVEEAVGMSAPQMKIASVHDDGTGSIVPTDGDYHGDAATQNFAASLASGD